MWRFRVGVVVELKARRATTTNRKRTGLLPAGTPGHTVTAADDWAARRASGRTGAWRNRGRQHEYASEVPLKVAGPSEQTVELLDGQSGVRQHATQCPFRQIVARMNRD